VALSHHAGGTCLPTCSPALHITRLAHAPRLPCCFPLPPPPPAAADQKLRAYFENYGTVQEAFVSYDKHTGRPRGFGFVVFADPIIADKVGASRGPGGGFQRPGRLQWLCCKGLSCCLPALAVAVGLSRLCCKEC
jgi:hypothetical protein